MRCSCGIRHRIAHRGDKIEPATVTGAGGVETCMGEFAGLRAPCVSQPEIAIPGFGLGFAPAALQHGLQHVQGLQFISHAASRRKLVFATLQGVKACDQRSVSGTGLQQGTRLGQEYPVVADIIDDLQNLVAGFSQSSTQLLQEQDGAFGRAQHHHGADIRQIDAFVEHVDGKQDVDLAPVKLFQRGRARCRARFGMDGDGAETGGAEMLSHEFRMAHRHAEPDRRPCGAFAELVQRIVGPGPGGHSRCQYLRIEPAAAPGDLLVIDIVGNAVIGEGGQQLPGNPVMQIAAIHQILPAEREQIRAVRPIRRRGQAQQELWREVIQKRLIAGRRRMVELVQHHIVERVRVEPLQMVSTAKGLNRGKKDVALALLDAVVTAHARLRSDPAERRHRLAQYFRAMSDKQHAVELQAVEGRQPRLSQPSRHHHQPGPVTSSARRRQRLKSLPLNAVGGRHRFRRVGAQCLVGEFGQRRLFPPRGIGVDPGRGERPDSRMRKECLEGCADVLCLAWRCGMQVPFYPLRQRGSGQVRTANDGGAGAIASPEHPSLGMKAALPGFENADQRIAAQIGQHAQRRRFGHIEIVPDYQSKTPATIEQIAKPRYQHRHAAFQREGHGQIHLHGIVDMVDQMVE